MKTVKSETFNSQQQSKQKLPRLTTVKVAASKMTKGGHGKIAEIWLDAATPNFYG
ncbi:MAG: acinetodin/klebsidin/J25 family lasso peptide [Sphingobacterium sp.]